MPNTPSLKTETEHALNNLAKDAVDLLYKTVLALRALEGTVEDAEVRTALDMLALALAFSSMDLCDRGIALAGEAD